MKMFQRILVATDFSPASTPAFEEAVKIAKREGALLLIAHSYHEPCLVELSREAQLVNGATFAPFTVYLCTSLLYFLVCFPLTSLSRMLERRAAHRR